MQKTDMELKTDIETELRWDPKLNAAQIGVVVDTGAVTLLGAVDTYAEKWAAEDAVKRVHGVRTVAQDLTVKLIGEHQRSDSEIAAAVQGALKWDVCVPKKVTAKVQQGRVTLEGSCTWNYEREAAERAVQYLTGIVSVINEIAIVPTASVTVVKDQLEAALQRQATTDASAIHITSAGGKVTLTGSAPSLRAIEDAKYAAWTVPGVTEIIDHLKLPTAY